MRLAGIVLMLTACSGLGFRLARLYAKRIEECVKIERSLGRLAGEIRFYQTP